MRGRQEAERRTDRGGNGVGQRSSRRNRSAELAHSILPGEGRVARAAHQSLVGNRHGIRAIWPFLGPAFIASVAYVDPGNFATNFAGGTRYGYKLVWVVVAANLIAMLVQSLSAKLGIATGRNLAEVCRDRFPRPLVVGLWLQAELIAIATDLAEVVGAALGLHLLSGLPLFPAACSAAPPPSRFSTSRRAASVNLRPRSPLWSA